MPTPMDIKIASVFDGECLRANDGTHLGRGILDDKVSQDRHRRVVACLLSVYDLPSGPVGRSFMKVLCKELKGVM